MRKASDGFACDIWSCGVMLFAMLTLTPLYCQPGDRAWRVMMTYGTRALLEHYQTFDRIALSPCARDLVFKMVDPSLETRYSIDQVLDHPWMRMGHGGDGEVTTTTTTTTTTTSLVSPHVSSPAAAASSCCGNNRHYDHHHRHYFPVIRTPPMEMATRVVV